MESLPPNVQDEVKQLRSDLFDCIDKDDWNLIKDVQKEELKIYSKQSTEFNGKVFKGVGTIHTSPENCYKLTCPKPGLSREKWDKTVSALEMVQPIRLDAFPEVYLLRSRTQPALMGLISGRDFVDLIVNIDDDRAVGTMAQSKKTELCPPKSDHVRGWNYYCGILAMRVANQPARTEMVYVAHADPGGSLPMSLVEKAVPSAILAFFSGIKDELKRAGHLT